MEICELDVSWDSESFLFLSQPESFSIFVSIWKMKKKLNRAEISAIQQLAVEFLLKHLLQCKSDLNLNSSGAQFMKTSHMPEWLTIEDYVETYRNALKACDTDAPSFRPYCAWFRTLKVQLMLFFLPCLYWREQKRISYLINFLMFPDSPSLSSGAHIKRGNSLIIKTQT